jgi:transposase InsO family protein
VTAQVVVGWSMADHLRTSLVVSALDMAATNVDLVQGAIFHSDRGIQLELNRSSQHRLVGATIADC